jgi:alcohol dehydrogenase class IV
VRGVQIIRKYLPVAYAEGRDLVAREHMQIGAYLGGLALNAGMVLGHSIAYTLAHRLRLAHGLSCALALAPCVAYNASAAPAQIELLAQGLGVAGEPVAVVDDIQRLASAVGIPRAWRDLGLAHEDLPAMVEECMARYPRPNNPKPLEREPLKRLYEAAWTGASPLQ